MKIGDLVKVKPTYPSAGETGVIVGPEVCRYDDLVNVHWDSGLTYYIKSQLLEVVFACG